MKKYLLGSSLVAGALTILASGYAGAADAIITLPANFMASVVTNVGQLFTDLQTVILVVAAIPLGFYVIRRVIGLVRAA